MRIAIDDLRKAADLILNQLAQEGMNEIELTKDYYWSIPAKQKYDPYAQPVELTLGQLSEDWKEIRRVAHGEQEASAYQLAWLGPLLCYLAEHV